MHTPLVTVVCLCYNHEHYLRESVESVLKQTYPNIQLILVDDASEDGSVEEIMKTIEGRPIEFLPLKKNEGNCRAFNKGLALARGEFVIDLSTDDVMTPDRVEKQVSKFLEMGTGYGVVFTDADYIDENGKFLRRHFRYLSDKGLVKKVPEGDVYANILSTYFIASPTMMIRKSVLEGLEGYDETLAYEDFDFWVRSSRDFKYAYLNEPLTKIRKRRVSMSTGWYKLGDRQLHSTYLVCRKAQKLNRNPEEEQALLKRVRFEFRQSVFSKNRVEADLFYELLGELARPLISDKLVKALNALPLPLRWLRELYHRIRY